MMTKPTKEMVITASELTERLLGERDKDAFRACIDLFEVSVRFDEQRKVHERTMRILEN